MTTWDMGISGFSWHEDEETLRREAAQAAEIGYRYAYGDMGIWGDGVLETATRAFESAGMKIWSTHGVTGVDAWEFDIDAAADRMSEQIERASEFGIGNITYHTMVNDTERDDPVIVAEKRIHFTARFHKLFGILSPLAEAKGVSLNVENIEGDFDSAYRTPEEILSIIEPIDSPAMGFCIDSGHAHMTGLSVADIIRKMGPYLRETHFHDNLGLADRHLPIGIGSIDWVAVIGALEAVNFAGPIVCEWVGTYWSDMPFLDTARAHYFNWRQYEDLAQVTQAG
jgi:sugar phosphate isomerase/epimerase